MVHVVRHSRWMDNFFGPRLAGLDQYGRLCAGIEAAIADADVVGTFRERFIDYMPAAARALALGAQARLSSAEMHEINFLERRLLNHLIEPHCSAGQLLTDANIHINMHQTGFLVNLIRRSKTISIISGNPEVANALGNVFGCATFDLTLVPGEFKWASDKTAWDRDKLHFPTVFDEVINRIRSGAL